VDLRLLERPFQSRSKNTQITLFFLVFVCVCVRVRVCVFSYRLLYIYAGETWQERKRGHFDRKKPPPPGGVPNHYVPSSRTVCKRTPLEEPGTNPSMGVLLHTVLDEGT